MNEQTYDSFHTHAPVQETVAYSRTERLLAPLTMAAGFLFVRLALYHAAGLLTTLLFWGIVTLCLCFLRRSGEHFTAGQRFVIAVLYLFPCVYTVTASPLLHTLVTLFLLLTGSLLLVSVTSGLHAVLRHGGADDDGVVLLAGVGALAVLVPHGLAKVAVRLERKGEGHVHDDREGYEDEDLERGVRPPALGRCGGRLLRGVLERLAWRFDVRVLTCAGHGAVLCLVVLNFVVLNLRCIRSLHRGTHPLLQR